ncbi:MAG: phosphonate metabolism protein/1,5-bisphosphokinase (PRPP-forming) PhnN [Promethearchaeota archaeon]
MDARGTLFLIVGNSGSGKDSLIRYVLENWPEGVPPPHVPTRVITRPPSPETEDFESATPEEFDALQSAGEFALWWTSYGMRYGVPKNIVDELESGRPVVVNVSRQVIPEARGKFPSVKVVFVRVPLEVTLERIKSRGREAGEDLERRIERARGNQDLQDADFVVDNTGSLEEAGSALRDYVLRQG